MDTVDDRTERAYLVGVQSPGMSEEEAKDSLAELSRLADTAGACTVGSLLIRVRRIFPATYMGSGQAEGLKSRLQSLDARTVLIDQDLSPAQNRNLERIWDAKVIDRTGLILDIFARRAHSQEGRLQVELAQMRYLAPRLAGRGTEFSQLAGRIGTRGPGETKLEIDRRKVRQQITVLQRGLKELKAQRDIYKERRRAVPIPIVSIVGYTNAGKSTLLNALTEKGRAMTQDKLFVTLDPLVRRCRLPSGREILLTDTVGFIRRLPHPLVLSFHATFEEIREASLVVHVIDVSHARWPDHEDVTLGLLADLKLDTKPRLAVYNKIDRVSASSPALPPTGTLKISALQGTGLDELVARMEGLLSQSLVSSRLFIPYERGDVVSTLYRVGTVSKTRYCPTGIRIEGWIPTKYRDKYKEFVRS